MFRLFSYRFLIVIALVLGLAPFLPKPHLLEKIEMLMAGNLTRAIDIFDLAWHSWPIVLLIVKLIIDTKNKNAQAHKGDQR